MRCGTFQTNNSSSVKFNNYSLFRLLYVRLLLQWLNNVPVLRMKCTSLILWKLNGNCPTVPLCLPSLRQGDSKFFLLLCTYIESSFWFLMTFVIGCLSCLWPPVCSTLSLALEPRTTLRYFFLHQMCVLGHKSFSGAWYLGLPRMPWPSQPSVRTGAILHLLNWTINNL